MHTIRYDYENSGSNSKWINGVRFSRKRWAQCKYDIQPYKLIYIHLFRRQQQEITHTHTHKTGHHVRLLFPFYIRFFANQYPLFAMSIFHLFVGFFLSFFLSFSFSHFHFVVIFVAMRCYSYRVCLVYPPREY